VLCPTGHETPTESAYCMLCGAETVPTAVRCPQGHETPPGSIYCVGCGTKVAAAGTQVPTVPPEPVPGNRSQDRVVPLALVGSVVAALTILVAVSSTSGPDKDSAEYQDGFSIGTEHAGSAGYCDDLATSRAAEWANMTGAERDNVRAGCTDGLQDASR
jgi:hypothetical protein